MLFRTKPLTAAAQTLATMLDDAKAGCVAVALQAPEDNAANIYFGDQGQQPAFIPPGGSTDAMPMGRLSELHVRGTVGDNVIVMVF